MAEHNQVDDHGNVWLWPNRKRDIDYASMSADEIFELDEECKKAGWFKTGGINPRDSWKGKYILERFEAPSDRLLTGLEESRAAWSQATGDLKQAAHSWHRHMEARVRWDASAGNMISWEDWKDGIGDGIAPQDAAGGWAYRNFCSIWEFDRWFLNWVLRSQAWTASLVWESENGKVVLPYPASGNGDLVRLARMFVGCREEWTMARRNRVGLDLMGVDKLPSRHVGGVWIGRSSWDSLLVDMDLLLLSEPTLAELKRMHDSARDVCGGGSDVRTGRREALRTCNMAVAKLSNVLKKRLLPLRGFIESQASAAAKSGF